MARRKTEKKAKQQVSKTGNKRTFYYQYKNIGQDTTTYK